MPSDASRSVGGWVSRLVFPGRGGGGERGHRASHGSIPRISGTPPAVACIETGTIQSFSLRRSNLGRFLEFRVQYITNISSPDTISSSTLTISPLYTPIYSSVLLRFSSFFILLHIASLGQDYLLG